MVYLTNSERHALQLLIDNPHANTPTVNIDPVSAAYPDKAVEIIRSLQNKGLIAVMWASNKPFVVELKPAGRDFFEVEAQIKAAKEEELRASRKEKARDRRRDFVFTVIGMVVGAAITLGTQLIIEIVASAPAP